MNLGYPSELETAWLMRHGASDTALLKPTYIRAANVSFLDRNTFEFDPLGVRALLFSVEEGDLEIDWVAWQPRQRKLATLRGAAFALGQGAIFNPATYFGGLTLRVHRTPLEWLLAERGGIVIVQPRFVHAYLREAFMSCADPALARELNQWIKPPQPKAKIFIEVSEERSAA